MLGEVEHEHGWQSRWNDEAALLRAFYDHPRDCYSFNICDWRPCAEESVHYSFGQRRNNLIRRDPGDDGRLRLVSASKPLCILDWAGHADDVEMEASRTPPSFRFFGSSHVPGGRRGTAAVRVPGLLKLAAPAASAAVEVEDDAGDLCRYICID